MRCERSHNTTLRAATYESYPFTGAGNGVGTNIEYDELDRVKKEANPGGTFRSRAYGLDTITVTDENSHATVYTRAAFGHPDDARLVGVKDAKDQQWTYTYDVAGALTGVTGPGGVTRSWTYNANHQLDTETHPESGSVTYTYDAGMLTQKTDARNTIFRYSYDGNDRLTTITAGTTVTEIAYEASSDNRSLVTATGVSTGFLYDAAGRLQSRTDTVDGKAFATRFAYDANDNLEEITYPSGRRVRSTFDSENRMLTVTRPAVSQTYASNFTYHPSGALAG